ncbi:MAG: hypothetical protein ACRDA4_08590 [Filifactoraceae bacterium]
MIEQLNKKGSQKIWEQIKELVKEDLEYYKFFIGSAKKVNQLGRELGQTKIEFISKTDNKINGYFSYIYDEPTRTAKGFELLGFSKDRAGKYSLMKDFALMLRCLHDSPDYWRIECEITQGAPSQRILEKLVQTGAFRIVGEKKNSIRLIDGNLYNAIIYECLKEV